MSEYHVSFPGLGLNDIAIDRIAFTFDIAGRQFSIYWYGLIIAFSFLLCIFLSSKEAPKHGIKSDDVIDTFLWIIILGLVGARLYYVIFSWDYFKDDLMEIFQTRNGGLAFYGGLIGGGIAVLISAKSKKINLMRFIDFFAVYVPLGQGIGRWGNFVNQEAFGKNTDMPWGMWSERTYEYLSQFGSQYAPMSPVHPTFLYEFIANMIIFVILYRARKNNTKNGKIFGLYLVLYGIVRFVVEGLRTDSLYIGNSSIRISQALSLLFVIGGAIILYLSSRGKFGYVPVTETTSDELQMAEDEVKDEDVKDDENIQSVEISEVEYINDQEVEEIVVEENDENSTDNKNE